MKKKAIEKVNERNFWRQLAKAFDFQYIQVKAFNVESFQFLGAFKILRIYYEGFFRAVLGFDRVIIKRGVKCSSLV